MTRPDPVVVPFVVYCAPLENSHIPNELNYHSEREFVAVAGGVPGENWPHPRCRQRGRQEGPRLSGDRAAGVSGFIGFLECRGTLRDRLAGGRPKKIGRKATIKPLRVAID